MHIVWSSEHRAQSTVRESTWLDFGLDFGFSFHFSSFFTFLHFSVPAGNTKKSVFRISHEKKSKTKNHETETGPWNDPKGFLKWRMHEQERSTYTVAVLHYITCILHSDFLQCIEVAVTTMQRVQMPIIRRELLVVDLILNPVVTLCP